MKRYSYILSALLIAFSTAVSNKALSQDANIDFNYITIEDGLSQMSVNCILQDSEGYMWFGTQSGLNKYNGSSTSPFEVYQHDLLDTNSLSSNWIFDLAEDKFGNIWVGTLAGLNKIEKKTGNIIRYLHDPYNPLTLNDEEVFGVHIDKQGYVWAKTSEAINRLDTVKGEFTHFVHQRDYFNIVKGINRQPIIEDELGNLWVATNDGLNYFDKRYEQFTNYNVSNSSISSNSITDLCFDNDKNLWVGTQDGLNKFNIKKKIFKNYFSHDITSSGLSQNYITSIWLDHLNNLWIGTFGGGLNKFDPREEKFTIFRQNKDNHRGISDDVIFSIYEDNSNILWVGTYSSGLNKVDIKKKKFQLYRETSGLSYNIIAGIYMDDKNHLWVGTWGNGLDIFDRQKGRIDHYSTTSQKNRKLRDDFVHVIFEDSKNRIWLGTRQGINIVDKKSGKVTLLEDHYENLIINNRVTSIIEDRRNNIWIGTDRILYRLDQKTKKVTRFSHNTSDPTTISSNHIYSILEDKDGVIWVGTVNGLNKFDYKTGKFINYKSDVNSPNTLSNNVVNCLYQDTEGYIWIATGSGLNKFDKKKETFTIYTSKKGLPSDLVFGILEDNSGNLWFSTGRGLVKLDKQSNTLRSFDKDDGLGGLEFNLGSYYKSKTGELFFGGIEGLNSFTPDSMKDNGFIPKVVISDFMKNTGKGIEHVFFKGKDEIRLSYKDYMFAIEFAALEYTNPKKNNYKYMMEGLSDEWINIGNINFASFSNVPAGEYVFRVKGSNNDLIWNEEGTSVRIIVEPHFLKTKWAYLVYVLIIASLIYSFIEYRTKSLKHANNILREKQLAALEIAKQKEELSIKNKSITDSINYAKRIQEAMMPSKYLFKRLLPDFFILYKPKDIVSGDFYWITEKQDKIFVAAVDCTGHGVPGAFMSIIGFDLLRNITNEQGVEEPAKILNLLNKGITETFSKNVDDHTVKDGMDLSLCVIDKSRKVIEYAGAMNPLYLLRDDQIEEIKANRFSIGMLGEEETQSKIFEAHTIPYQDGDIIYLFSDGYPDQFGGPLGKKFKYRRFKHSLLTSSHLPMKKQREFLEENIESWRGELEQVDDILVIGIKLTGL